MVAEGAGKVRLAEADFDFRPVKTWLGRQATEKVEGWETEVGGERVLGCESVESRRSAGLGSGAAFSCLSTASIALFISPGPLVAPPLHSTTSRRFPAAPACPSAGVRGLWLNGGRHLAQDTSGAAPRGHL